MQVKKLARMIPLIAIVLLTSCQSSKSSGQELALDIRTTLLEASKLEMTVNVAADYGDRVYDFTFNYSGDANNGQIELTAPEAVAGLKAKVSVSGGTLEYDGAVLDTGAVTADGLSPADVLPVLISQWESGYISGCNYEKLGDINTLAVTTNITETVSQRTWFDVKTLLPLRSELSDNDRMVLSCEFGDVIIEK